MFLDQCSLYDCFFFCARRFNFVTQNYPSYHPYRIRLIISPGLYNFVRGLGGLKRRGLYPRELISQGGLYIFVRGFRRAYKWRSLYPRALINGGAYIRGSLYNFVKGFRRAYKPGNVTYSCACTKKVLQTQAALVLSKILFEFTRFYKLQNVVKIDAILIQT